MSYPESISPVSTNHLVAYAAMRAGEFEKTDLFRKNFPIEPKDNESLSSRITLAAETQLTSLSEISIVNDSPITTNDVVPLSPPKQSSGLRSQFIIPESKPGEEQAVKPVEAQAVKVEAARGFVRGSLRSDSKIVIKAEGLAFVAPTAIVTSDSDYTEVLNESFRQSEWGSALAANSLQEESFGNSDDDFDAQLAAAMAMSLEANPYVNAVAAGTDNSDSKFNRTV